VYSLSNDFVHTLFALPFYYHIWLIQAFWKYILFKVQTIILAAERALHVYSFKQQKLCMGNDKIRRTSWHMNGSMQIQTVTPLYDSWFLSSYFAPRSARRNPEKSPLDPLQTKTWKCDYMTILRSTPGKNTKSDLCPGLKLWNKILNICQNT
jgi:hypothetical protein